MLKHIYREANKLVYSFAKHELSIQSDVCFYNSVFGFATQSFGGC